MANPQAPPIGRGGRVLGRFQIAGAFWLRAALLIARAPHVMALPVIGCFVTLVWVTCGGIRRGLARNAEWIHGAPLGWFARQRAVLATLVQFAHCFNERNESLFPGRWQRFRHDYSGLEHWEASGADRGAAILVTAHVGGWEVASLAPSATGRRLHLVREREATPEMQRIFARALAARGVEDYVTHFASAPTLGVDLLAALREGDLVALQGDRPRSGGDTLEVELFGRPTLFPLGPFLLAHLTGTPLLPVFNLRVGRRHYRLEVRPPIVPDRTLGRPASLERLSRGFALELEAVLREAPDQWFRFGDASATSR